MLGFHDKEARERAEFFLKYFLLTVSGLWILLTGTAYLDRRSKLLSIEAIPVADTQLNPRVPQREEPFEKDGVEYCRISGQYVVRNAGKLAFDIDQVTFDVRKLRDVDPPPGATEASSYALRQRIGTAPSVLERPVTIPIGERFGPGNELQVSYGFVIRREKDEEGRYHAYSIIANGSGGLPGDGGWLGWLLSGGSSAYARFGTNDLRHDSGLYPICAGALNPPGAPPGSSAGPNSPAGT